MNVSRLVSSVAEIVEVAEEPDCGGHSGCLWKLKDAGHVSMFHLDK